MTHATILALPGSLSASISLSAEMLSAADDLARSQHQRSTNNSNKIYQPLTVTIAGLEPGDIYQNAKFKLSYITFNLICIFTIIPLNLTISLLFAQKSISLV